MKSFRILFILSLIGLLASCKPSPAIQLTQEFTGTRWQLVRMNVTYGYEIEERYTKTEDNYRYVNQSGTLSIDYSLIETEGVWRVSSYYDRDEESQLGQEPTQTVAMDTTLNLTSIWRFGVQNGIPDEVFQQYYETIPTCNRVFNMVSDWSVEDSENFSTGDRDPIVRFQLAHLFTPDFAGDLVFYPTIFDRDGYIDLVTQVSTTTYFGQEALQFQPAYDAEAFELRSQTFEDNAYGTVQIEEKVRTLYIEAVFVKVEEDPC